MELISLNIVSITFIGAVVSIVAICLYAMKGVISLGTFIALETTIITMTVMFVFSDVPDNIRDSHITNPEYYSTDLTILKLSESNTLLRKMLDIYVEGGIIVVEKSDWVPFENDLVQLIRFSSEQGSAKTWRLCLSDNQYQCLNVISKPESLGLTKEYKSFSG